jgi:cellulose biosynthesis protein BcsQ
MKVITCFSYKGGAGRTTAAANIAAALASTGRNVGSIQAPLGRKVALVDLDVFSAGTHRVFEITNDQLNGHKPCIQDYLRDQMAPAAFIEEGGIKFGHKYMENFRSKRGGEDNCHAEFTLFPAKPDPGTRFVVQKQHENVLVELVMELESQGRRFDYIVLDGESGTRQMADIALRMADVVLMFFRLTWQHIEGTLNYAREFPHSDKPFYLIPSCVPLVGKDESIYQQSAPGLKELVRLTEGIPEASELNKFTHERRKNAGHFWAGANGAGGRLCIHDSLCLKGEERIIVFDTDALGDRAAQDYYRIAAELDKLHPPN